MELIKFLKPGWDIRLGSGRIILEATSEAEGNDLLDSDIELLEASAANWGLEIVVGWVECQHPVKISPPVSNCNKWLNFLLNQLSKQMTNLITRDTDLALEAYSSEFPVWVTRMTDQKVLLCNQLAIDTQQKDPTELLGESIVPLWDNDPLEIMIQYLQRDQQLTNYENPGYRWVKEDNSPIWKRSRFVFVTDYRLTTFLGQPCRISFTKSAEPV